MVLGKRINAWSLGRKADYERGSRFWHNVAMFVMRRPLPVAVVKPPFVFVTAVRKLVGALSEVPTKA